MKKHLFTLFLLLFSSLFAGKLPDITSQDVYKKTQEILEGHVTYKALNQELMERTLQNFLLELDPTKTYFLESDIQNWWYPSDVTLKRVLFNMAKGSYQDFFDIHNALLSAIERRKSIEEKIAISTPPKGVNPEEFKDISWAFSEEDLMTRLLRIKALQLEAAEKIKEETKDLFLQRLDKRRHNREAELIASSAEERNKLTLTYVLKAFLSALDPHSYYLTPGEANQMMYQVQQRLFGIGAQLKDNLNGFKITTIIEGGPASQSKKLKVNDIIIAVNKEVIVGMELFDAVELIRGEKGSTALLTILRETPEKEYQTFDIEIVRGEVVIEEARLDTNYEPFGDGIIAHLSLFTFYQDEKNSSALDIQKALLNLKKDHKIKAVILDLRNNSGGLLEQAVAVSGLFITKGVVVSVKDNKGNIYHKRDTTGKTVFDGPLILLINRASASAAEIVAQTLQDYGRALIVGDEHSFGKGSIQTFTLETNTNGKANTKGEYKLTRGLYYTVSGKSPQLKGVQSDIVIPGILSKVDIGEQYLKYPLAYDEISPSFEDNLEDIPQAYRKNTALFYKHNLQTILETYKPYMEILKNNSKLRLEHNKNYQTFLKELENKNYESQALEVFGQADLQLIEAKNITKDLVFLMETPQVSSREEK